MFLIFMDHLSFMLKSSFIEYLEIWDSHDSNNEGYYFLRCGGLVEIAGILEEYTASVFKIEE
jgi:hypothetical protein